MTCCKILLQNFILQDKIINMLGKECIYLYYSKIFKEQTSLNSRNRLRTEVEYQVESRIHTLPLYQWFKERHSSQVWTCLNWLEIFITKEILTYQQDQLDSSKKPIINYFLLCTILKNILSVQNTEIYY